jgi:glycine oxidase
MSRADFDAIIIGQGLAGTALAWSLRWRGCTVLVVDRGAPGTTSRIAAGLMTPITGRRLVKSWRWDQFWNFACKFYRRIESECDATFFEQRTMVRLLSNATEQEFLARRQTSDPGNFLPQPSPLVCSSWFNDPWGGFEMEVGGRLKVAEFLDVSRLRFHRDEQFLVADLDPQHDIQLTDRGVQVPRLNLSARHLCFCQGVDAVHNVWFREIAFNLAKGEILTLKIDGLAETRIVHRGVWLMPLGGDLFRAGATYEWNDLNSIPTEKGRDEILLRLREFLKLPVEVVAHDAAVRPILKHQYPVAGVHPRYRQLSYLNGLGSKGSLQSPWLADYLAALIAGESQPDPELQFRHYHLESNSGAEAQLVLPKVTSRDEAT